MAYHHYEFPQYFIDNSEDWNHTGKATRKIHYKKVTYSCNGLERLFHFHHEMNYEIFYDRMRNVIQLNFQKTNGWSDWIANVFEFPTEYYDEIEFEGKPLQLRVHRGWGAMYRSVKNDIRREWKCLHEKYPDAETEIVGWSLGAGQATLCCQDLNYNFGIRPHLFTYGSVKPFAAKRGEGKRLRRYLLTVCADCYNFANVNDIVTYMPPFKQYCMVNRVEVGGGEKRTIGKLLRPRWYHTIYDKKELYEKL